MKVLIPASSFFPSQEGGPSNTLYWLASGLARAGYSVRVVTTNRCIASDQVEVNKWIRLNDFDVIYASQHTNELYLREELAKCDVLIANGVCSLRNFNLNAKAIKLGIKVILSPRGELFDSAVYHKGRLHGYLKTAMFLIMRAVYHKKVLFHATSIEEVESIKKYMGNSSKIVLIPNYMILPDRELVDTDSEHYLLYVGRLNEIKNIDTILLGLAKSNCFIKSNFSFYIAGEKKGEYYNYLIELAKELGISKRIKFLGLVTGEEKNKLYANAKCLFLMSKSENFGNVIIEALSQGTPVITSTGTPWHLLEDKRAGRWIEAKPDIIAAAVDDLLSMPSQSYERMREAAFSLSRNYDVFTNIYEWKRIIDN